MKDKCVDFVLMISIVFSDKFPASPGSGLTLTPGPLYVVTAASVPRNYNWQYTIYWSLLICCCSSLWKQSKDCCYKMIVKSTSQLLTISWTCSNITQHILGGKCHVVCRATLKIFEKKLLIVLEYFLDDLTPTCNISLFIKRCHVPSENIHVQEETGGDARQR